MPLIALAHGRSGDKGDIANIGVLARQPEFAARAAAAADGARPSATISRISPRARSSASNGRGSTASTSCCIEGLGGGGIASLRHDPQGKAMAQILMDLPVAGAGRTGSQPGGPLAGWGEGSPA